ncbi:MAG: hypothetical protein OWR62_10980 [Sulfobacillus thermotolerans]|nr:hypothetical protein [Sulfobacillus thermotolerans]
MHENVWNQTFTADCPHAVWMADIPDIPTEEGWLYLTSLEDLVHPKNCGMGSESAHDARFSHPGLRPRGHAQPVAGRGMASRGSGEPIGRDGVPRAP